MGSARERGYESRIRDEEKQGEEHTAWPESSRKGEEENGGGFPSRFGPVSIATGT